MYKHSHPVHDFCMSHNESIQYIVFVCKQNFFKLILLYNIVCNMCYAHVIYLTVTCTACSSSSINNSSCCVCCSFSCKLISICPFLPDFEFDTKMLLLGVLS